MEKELFSKSYAGVAWNSTTISTAGQQSAGALWIDTLGFESCGIMLLVNTWAGGTISGVQINTSNLFTGTSTTASPSQTGHTDAAVDSDANVLYYPLLFPWTGAGGILISSVAKTRFVQLLFTTTNPTVSMTVTAYYILSDAWAQPPLYVASVETYALMGGMTTEGDAAVTFPKRTTAQ